MSFTKTLYPLLSTGSTQEDLSQYNWKIVDWDIKKQIKQQTYSYKCIYLFSTFSTLVFTFSYLYIFSFCFD